MNIKKANRLNPEYLRRSEASIKYAINKIKNSNIAPYINQIYLYGSCARKEQKLDSDVDLFLELISGFDMQKYRDELIMLKSKVTPTDSSLPEVDLKIVVGESWKSNKSLYYKNVKRDGVKIWTMI